MITPGNWRDYELLDSGDSMKLERWGQYIIARPEPQAIWHKFHDDKFCGRAQAVYTRGLLGQGKWDFKQELPERWKVNFGNLSFWVSPTDFKHTGLFPEQAVNWVWIRDKVQFSINNFQRVPKILNLFAYTGGATLACLEAGASVTHVDASEGIIDWAKENATLSGLAEKPVRWIVDDVSKFVAREERRGENYDAIIMDPPSYGRGKKNELWKIETMLTPLVEKCLAVLSDDPLFFVINSYTTGVQEETVINILKSVLVAKGGTFESDTIGLKPRDNGYTLPAGCVARWHR